MNLQATLALSLIFATPVSNPEVGKPTSEEMKTMEFAGLTFHVGPLETKFLISGKIKAEGKVNAYGATGTFVAYRGFTSKEIHVKLSGMKVEKLAAVFQNKIPPGIFKQLVGTINEVTLDITNDVAQIELKQFKIRGDPVQKVIATINMKTHEYKATIHALGGIAEAEGTLPKRD